MVCHCLLIENPGLVLVETGVGAPASSRPKWLARSFCRVTNPTRDLAETTVAQIAALGYDREDVRHIVLTAWIWITPVADRLPRRERAPLRPRATRPGSRRCVGPNGCATSASSSPTARILVLPRYRRVVVRFRRGPRDGRPGLRDPAHSTGWAYPRPRRVAVDTGEGWLLNAGDSYFFHGELGAVAPHCPPGLALIESLVQTERRARLDSQQPLRELVTDHGPQIAVFSAHDAVEFRRCVQRTSGALDPSS